MNYLHLSRQALIKQTTIKQISGSSTENISENSFTFLSNYAAFQLNFGFSFVSYNNF